MRHTLLILLFVLLGSPGWSADEQIVLEVSGNGARNLRPFTIKDNWEIRWDNKGTMITIAIRYADGKMAAMGGSAEKPGRGSSYQPKGGTYFLEVTGTEDWTVQVVQLPPK